MSFVTTATWKRSRSRLQRASTRAVFPDPTGPPTPTRSTCLSFMVVYLFELCGVRRRSRSEQPRVLILMQSAGQHLSRRSEADVLVRAHAQTVVHDIWNAHRKLGEQTLPSNLAHWQQPQCSAHLILQPGHAV